MRFDAGEARRDNRLPADRTSFIGRDEDLSSIARLFADGARVVTLVGPAGVGKTRLAREFAARAPAAGVCFCDLGEARSSYDVLAAVAAGLGIAILPGATVEAAGRQLGHALAARRDALVLVDNFEQVVSHAESTLAVWSRMAPAVSLLVTSRTRLRIEGEACYEVPPLPDADAARLFEERARLTHPGFTLAEGDSEAVREIARRLDGAPLAIELAAARVAVLPPRALLERLGARLDLLRSSKESTARHASLRAAIEWSWELLGRDERDALAEAAVFHGGFTLPAAEAVLSRSGAPIVDVVQALVDQSLARCDIDPELGSEARFSLYESVREYADDQLASAGRRNDTLERHAAYYVARGEAWAAELVGPRAEENARRLWLERDNLLAVLREISERDPDIAARAALCLDGVLAARGPAEGHLAVLDAALDAGPEDPRLRIRLVTSRGVAERMRGQLAEARTDLEHACGEARRHAPELEASVLCAIADLHLDAGAPEDASSAMETALALTHEAADERMEATVLYTLGRAHLDRGDLHQAEAHCERALTTIGKLGLLRLEGRVHNLLGIVCLRRGQNAEAESQFSRALSSARDLSDHQQECTVLANLAKALADRGEHDQAVQRFDEGLGLARRMGYRRSEGVLLNNRAMLDHDRGRLAEARAGYVDALAIHREVGNRRFEAIVLEFRGTLELEQGRLDEAAPLLAEALGLARERRLGAIEGFALAHLGALEAGRGDIPEAHKTFEEARSVHQTVKGAELIACIELLEATVDIALAREAAAKGSQVDASAHRARASARFEASTAPSERWSLLRIGRRIVALALEGAPAGEGAAPLLELGPEARWFRAPGGERVDLSRRRSLRLIVRHLAAHWEIKTGQALSLDELLEAGWPGERLVREAGIRRVYTAIGMLRDLGLRGVLVRRDDGYLIDPDVEVRSALSDDH